jgi:hypothetical protein
MRKLVLAGLVTAASVVCFIGPKPAAAAEGPWCHTFGGSNSGPLENCSMRTFEMCRQEIQGNGGSCSPNPRWHGYLPQGGHGQRRG